MSRRRHRWWLLGLLLALPLAAGFGLRWLLPPERLGALALRQAEQALELQLDVSAPAQLVVWPRLQLELIGLGARAPGAAEPLLRAERIAVALPWRSLWSGVEFGAIELEAPQLDVVAVAAWQASRRSAAQSQTLAWPRVAGVTVRRGRVQAPAWQLDEITLESAAITPQQSSRIVLSAVLLREALRLPIELEVRMTPQPQAALLEFSGRFDRVELQGESELIALLAWWRAGEFSVAPPLQLQASAERLDIAGAQIEGLRIDSGTAASGDD